MKKSPRLAVRTVDRFFERLRKLPPARNRYVVERSLRTPARDGSVLVGDHYFQACQTMTAPRFSSARPMATGSCVRAGLPAREDLAVTDRPISHIAHRWGSRTAATSPGISKDTTAIRLPTTATRITANLPADAVVHRPVAQVQAADGLLDNTKATTAQRWK